ncbi:MAG: hypothetical protein M1818_005787 [Claussenomyces sp. TS43310]|nr:MAG: hypothetical protein M1818_005787 [Claussenomyces sp. TS43310]
MLQRLLSILSLFTPFQNPIHTPSVVHLPGYGAFSGRTISQTLSGSALPAPVHAWLGIDYGTQPQGPGRFAPVAPPAEFSGVKPAHEYGNICVQLNSAWIHMGEDCLSMNVFRPEDAGDAAKLPVLVWVHGGSFQSGSSRDFDGASFVASSRTPLMVVTFNYRLGSLGFLPSRLFEDHGLLNLGLQDQYALLKFVQKYISEFGGDPEKVTVGGLSAGAHAVGFHYQHIEEGGKPLLHQAIMQSGGPTARAFPNHTYPLYQQNYAEYLSAVGCSEIAGDSAVLACLREIDIKIIWNVGNRMFLRSMRNVTWPFQPVSGGPLIPQLGSTSYADGKFNKVPVLTSYSTNEGRAFTPHDLSTNDDVLEWISTIAPGLDQKDKEIITNLYPDPQTDPLSPYANSPLSPQYYRAAALYSDYSYICSAQENAVSISRVGVPVWKLHFDTNNSRPWYMGIPHAADMSYIWNEPKVQHPQVAHFYHAYYASFVAAGDPNAHQLRGSPAWTGYAEGGTHLGVQLRLSSHEAVMERDVCRRQACEFWRGIHEKLTR